MDIKKDAIVWRSAHCCILFCFRKRSLSYSNVISCVLIPKNIWIISFSLSVSVESALSISLESDSLTSERSAIGESSFTRTSSKLLSSPSTKGASTEMWRPETFSVSEILSTGISSSSASSSGEGRRSFSCSNLENALLILFSEPT